MEKFKRNFGAFLKAGPHEPPMSGYIENSRGTTNSIPDEEQEAEADYHDCKVYAYKVSM